VDTGCGEARYLPGVHHICCGEWSPHVHRYVLVGSFQKVAVDDAGVVYMINSSSIELNSVKTMMRFGRANTSTSRMLASSSLACIS
jgi:hypothetical protein